MPVTVVPPVAQFTVSFVGRTVCVVAGPQDSTAGTEAEPAVVVVDGTGAVVADDRCEVVVDTRSTSDLVVGDRVVRMFNPMAIPITRDARTSAATPIRTMVLRRKVITRGSLGTTRSNRSSRNGLRGRR